MTTAKYHQSDDGKEVDGKTVVWIEVPKEDVAWVEELGEESEAQQKDQEGATKATDDKKKDGDKKDDGKKKAPQKKKVASTAKAQEAHAKSAIAPGQNAKKQQKVEMAKLTAASLTKAAKDGKPFCEECEKARQELEAKKRAQLQPA